MSDLTSREFWNNRWKDARGSQGRGFLLNTRETKRVFQKVLDLIPAGGKMIELGSAPGSVLRKYHELRPDLTYDGLDISDKGVTDTNTLFQKLGIKGTTVLGDFRSPPENLVEAYDIVTSHGLIEHFDDFTGAVQGHFKFAKSGGIIFLTIPNYANPVIHKLLKNFSQETIDSHNFFSMSKESLASTVNDEVELSWIPECSSRHGDFNVKSRRLITHYFTRRRPTPLDLRRGGEFINRIFE